MAADAQESGLPGWARAAEEAPRIYTGGPSLRNVLPH